MTLNLEELKLQWEALENWKKVLILLGFSIGLVYLIYIFKLQDILAQKAKLENDIQNLSREIKILKRTTRPEKMIQIKNQISKLKSEINQREKELNNLKNIIPQEANIDNLLQFIAENVYKSNLSLDKFKVVKTEKVYVSYNPSTKKLQIRPAKKRNSHTEKRKKNNEITLYRLIINVKLSGSPKNLVKYVKNISQSKQFLMIDDIDLQKTSTGIKTDMNLSTFYSKGEEK